MADEWLGFPFAAPLESPPPAEEEEEEEEARATPKRQHQHSGAGSESSKKRSKQSGKKAAKRSSTSAASKPSSSGGGLSRSSSSGSLGGGSIKSISVSNGNSSKSRSTAAADAASSGAMPQRHQPSRDATLPTSVWKWQASKVTRGQAGQPIPDFETLGSSSKKRGGGASSSSSSSTALPSPDADWVVVALAPGEQLVCIGSAHVCCLKGRIDVLGLVLDGRDAAAEAGGAEESGNGREDNNDDGRGASVTVHAPTWHGAVTIRALDNVREGHGKTTAAAAVAAWVLMVAVLRPLNASGGGGGGGGGDDDGGDDVKGGRVRGRGGSDGGEWLLTAAADGEDARWSQRKRLRHGGPGRRQTSSSTATDDDNVEGDDDDVSNLALPGWCVLAPNPGGGSSGDYQQHHNQHHQRHHGYAVTLVPESWRASADRLVRQHVRQLDRRMTRRKLLDVRRRRLEQEQGRQGEGQEQQTLLDSGSSGDDSEQPLVAMVCGAKGVGKSSCVRYLVNRLASARRDWLRAQLLTPSPSSSASSSPSALRSRRNAWRRARLMLLDLDVGQPEMTPPGLLSLHAVGGCLRRTRGHSHGEGSQPSEENEEGWDEEDEGAWCPALVGPPHTHLHHPPLRACFLGDTTPKRNPAAYLHCVAQLAAEFQSRTMSPTVANDGDRNDGDGGDDAKEDGHDDADAQAAWAAGQCLSGASAPLVVNCDGWVKGLGLDLLGHAMHLLRPTHVLQVSADAAVPNAAMATTASAFRSKHFELPAAVPFYGVGVGAGVGGVAEPSVGSGSSHPAPDVQCVGSWDAVCGAAGGGATAGGERRTTDGAAAAAAAAAADIGEAGEAANTSPAVRVAAASPADQRTVRIAAYFARGALAHAKSAAAAPAIPPPATASSASALPPLLPLLPRLTAAVRNGALADSDCSLAALLAAAPPFRVPMAALALRSLDGAEPPNFTERLHAFNGALVGLAAYHADGSANGNVNEDPAASAAAAAMAVPECLGLGIVRSVDCAARCLYVLTPVAPALLRRCNVLLHPPSGSGVTLPTQLLYTSSAQTYPYLFCESAGSAATAMKSRNNLQRGGSSSNLLNSS